MVHICKMMMSLGVFFIFWKFLFLGLLGGKRAKNSPKWKNNYVCHMPHLRKSIAYDHDFWYTVVKWWYLQAFFFHFPFIGLLGEVKWQKTVQNDKTFCLSCCICQEQYIIWLSFMVQMWKMIISPGSFQFFKM